MHCGAGQRGVVTLGLWGLGYRGSLCVVPFLDRLMAFLMDRPSPLGCVWGRREVPVGFESYAPDPRFGMPRVHAPLSRVPPGSTVARLRRHFFGLPGEKYGIPATAKVGCSGVTPLF